MTFTSVGGWRRGAARLLAPVAALSLLGLVACGDDADGAADAPSDDTGGPPASLVEGVEVEVGAFDNSFRPEKVTVEAGTEVVWENRGRNEHDVLPAEGDAWGVEVEGFAPGDSYRHRFTEPGTYAYYCSLHGTAKAGMVGTVEVTG